MEKDVLIREIMWEYDYTKAKAASIVDEYEKNKRYEDLCELVITKKELCHATGEYV